MLLFQQFILLIFGAVCSTALLTVEVELIRYSNPSFSLCDGSGCDAFLESGGCDNIFEFCLRKMGSSSCLSSINTDDTNRDNFNFDDGELRKLGISNPLRFTDIATTVDLELFVDVEDEDKHSGDDQVEKITIPFNYDWRADGEYSPIITQTGSCRRASLKVRIRIISQCPGNMTLYGPNCSLECIEVENVSICNYLGEGMCIANNFAPPDCEHCVANYYPEGECDVFCMPQDDSGGHYTCNSVGEFVCLPPFTDPDTNCTKCQNNFQGSNCEDCVANYYPEGECDIFCIPQDDSSGHFKCNPVTGERECLEGFIEPENNCIESSSKRTTESDFLGSPTFFFIFAIVIANVVSG